MRQFRVRQQSDYATTVSIVAQPCEGGLSGEIVSRAVRSVVGADVRLNVEFVPVIPPLESGKHRYVISDVVPPQGLCMTGAEQPTGGVTP